jgi:hypothetical protein
MWAISPMHRVFFSGDTLFGPFSDRKEPARRFTDQDRRHGLTLPEIHATPEEAV